MTRLGPLLQILLISTVTSQNNVVKIRFGESSNRPVRDPDGDTSTSRRSFWNPRDALCRTAGSTAGALVAHRLTSSGTLSRGERVPGHALLDLRTFISLVATAAIQGLDVSTGCPPVLLQSAAEEMSLAVVCASGGVPVPRERCLAQALLQNGVLNAVPALVPYGRVLPVVGGCVGAHFNFKLAGAADFQSNPQKHVAQLVMGLQTEVMAMHNMLITANARPLDIPQSGIQAEQEYVRVAVEGAIIATYVAKVTAQTGAITNIPGPGRHDVTAFFSFLTGRVIRALNISPPQMAIRTHNIAVKMGLYWFINNNSLLKASPPSLITGNTLANLGLAPYFPSTPRLATNNEPVRALGLFVFFPDIPNNLEATSALVESRIPYAQISNTIKAMLPTEPIPISDEVIRLETVPMRGTAAPLQSNMLGLFDTLGNADGAQGALPRPEDWFSTNAPAVNASKEANAVVLGTIAVVVGAHAGRLIPDLGLVTRQGEYGYKDLTTVDIYQNIQNIIEHFVRKLMTVIPMSLDTGFYILNASFKTAKLALNLEAKPENMPPTSTLIPLGLKYNNLLQFHPELQHLQWDLWPLPPKLQPLQLWVKPALNVNLEEAMNERTEKLARTEFPKVLSDIVSTMKYHVPDLNIYNVKTLLDKIADALPWDPPEVLSYLYDPSPCDGVPETLSRIDPPKTPLVCPGHFLCPPDTCKLPECAHYVCDSKDPWCYFPPDIKCPGSISCPVQIETEGKTLVCPEDKDCPIVSVTCPGRSECPDETTTCPGGATCPLKIKCPGTLCPSRYTSRPQTLLPCPGHPLCALCSKQAIPDTLVCTTEMSCSYPSASSTDVVAAIKEAGEAISSSLDRKKFSVNINNTAVSHLMMDGKKIASSASGTIIRDSKAAVASAASSSGDKKTTTTTKPPVPADYADY